MYDCGKQFARLVGAAALILAVLVVPGSVAAQPAGPTPEELREAAELLFPTPTRHAEAAQLLCREADVRSVEDLKGVEAALLCGKLYYYVEELALSRDALEDAAQRALSLGDVVRAAHALVDASLVAERQSKSRAVVALAGRARMLARSPLLTPRQRSAIEQRIGGTLPSNQAGM